MLGEAGLNICKNPNQIIYQKRDSERDAEFLNPFSEAGSKKRNIENKGQRILRKIDGHVVTKIFPDKILEENPANEDIEPSSPIIENRDDDHAPDYQEGKVRNWLNHPQ